MRAGLSLLLPILVQATGYDRTSPFHQPVIDGSDIIARDGIEALLLLKRQNGCPAGFNSCAFLDAPGACCQRDTICSRDDANNIACCPTGAACTGILTQPGTATTTNPPSLTGSTVPNAPFPFSICLSLSREACYGLQEAYCTAFQDGSSGASPPSTRTSPLYEILTGLGIALAGMIA
ncbi:hypothetical protein CISG_10257 [Coccidioides immitis RMSCC 3703]|uniref:Uncharacterized protein n=1 Tax=Coccidioides immitis RMSCC 3703 TaxID=454286 RepID=A0A0J8QNI4_COCIT|nr:hypothetical protein CISG_10257 [Coccidioides immitis RMSCC 3703]